MARRRSSRGSYSSWSGYDSPFYSPPTTGEIEARAHRDARSMGGALSPVRVQGRLIARSFWGRAWCDHLESHADFSNRLPRGRKYVRNGAVIDLRISMGRVIAKVSGTRLYQIDITIDRLAKAQSDAIERAISSSVGTLVELLEGKLSEETLRLLSDRDRGVFPRPREFHFSCSCPDSASMCKHVAATLYGVGARLDAEPLLLFKLRGIDPDALIARPGERLAQTASATSQRILEDDDLSAMFGIDLGGDSLASPKPRVSPQTPQTPAVGAAPRRARKGSQAESDATPPRVVAPNVTTIQADASLRAGAKVTAKELVALGIPRSTITYWIRRGVLIKSAGRGVYLATSDTQPRVRAYLAGVK
ncbi:MAG: type IV toxin-antitoxin system AbiEi family antitoxin domain-containing protein [Deltaproteobacteria bacterium]|nr:type IV toxin-antitoxin system AbiEi family antitoxin domain-containing protein [Deltaproteobacteria bacterium]